MEENAIVEKKFLSGSDLFSLRNKQRNGRNSQCQIGEIKCSSKVKRLPKDLKARSDLIDQCQRSLNLVRNLIATERMKPIKDLGKVIWLPERKIGHLVKNKSKPAFMGFTEERKDYLHPEEVLFLMESESIVVYLNDLPVSLQEAWSMFLINEEEMNSYIVYAHLIRIGYQIRRHQKILDEEFTTNSSQLKRKICDDKFVPSKIVKHASNDAKVSIRADSIVQELTIKTLKKSMLYYFNFKTDDDIWGTLKPKQAANWKEYKEQQILGKTIQQMNEHDIYKGVLINGPVASHLDHLPSSKLIAGDIVPLNTLGYIRSYDEFHAKLKEEAPKLAALETTESNRFNPSFDVFLPNKSLKGKPDSYLVVTQSKETPPNLSDIVNCEKISDVLFALVDGGDISFYKFKAFECWDEFPVMWKNALRPCPL